VSEALLELYARLGVQVGANVQPGQLVEVSARVEHAPLARAVARCAYEAGASYVDVAYADQHVRRAMIEHADDATLSWTPPWLLTRMRGFGEQRAAAIGIVGDPEPELLADLDGARVGKARMPELADESMRQVNEGLVNWTVIACPNEGWARAVYGEPDVDRLWRDVAYCARLDEDDPTAAWREHVERLDRRTHALNALHLDAVRFTGPGTDLTVGLLDTSRWKGARSFTRDGVAHVPNMPTEEVFTTPDARRTEGRVRATRPAVLYGKVVHGLEVRFEAGRIVDVQAESGADVVEGQLSTDDRAAYLGEIALVDGTSRVGRKDLTFFNTLFDENATCHIAYGGAYAETVEGETTGLAGFNESTVHTDFMIGGPEVDVDAVTRDGSVVPLLREDVWQLD
jgi:aminopeptidase